MQLDLYQIDDFTSSVFSGHPAAVCPLNHWPDDSLLLNIAKENNLAEPAYFLPKADGTFHLRWFTPEIEMDLCGHATLASAFVLFEFLNHTEERVVFHTQSGILEVLRTDYGLLLDLPSRPPEQATLPSIIADSLSHLPLEVWKARDFLLVYESEAAVANLKVDAQKLKEINLDPGGIIVSAPGKTADFVSRFFTPGAAVFEDPVTGSAHCTLTPFWAARLGKTKLVAHQVSERGGVLWCEDKNDRVQIAGQAVCYLQGTITV